MIANRSKKRAKQERLYTKLAKEFLTDNPQCQVNHRNCTHESIQVHHKAGRIGDLLTDISNFLAVCYNCHSEIELNPRWAKEKGFSVSRLSIKQ